MKKIRKSAWVLLLTLMLVSLAACGRRNTDNTGQGTGGANTTQSPITNETAGPAGNGTTGNGTTGNRMETSAGMESTGAAGGKASAREESSTGVIDGLVDDVERGINDVTGQTKATGAADESR